MRLCSCSYTFLLYINDLPDDVICNIAIHADNTTLYCKCGWAADLWRKLELASELESDLRDTVEFGRKWHVDFKARKFKWFCLTNLMTLVLLIWKLMGLFLKKNHILRCWGWLSLLNWIEALTLSLLLKLPPGKLESWFVLWSFFLLRLLCISTEMISYRNEYAGHLVLHLLPLLSL